MQQICSQNSLKEVIGSILPILTKCKPGVVGLDIDEIRSVFSEQLSNNLLSFQQSDKPHNSEDDELLVELSEFYNQIAFSLEIFDPMDRCIPSEEDNQAQQSHNLKDVLVQLPPLKG